MQYRWHPIKPVINNSLQKQNSDQKRTNNLSLSPDCTKLTFFPRVQNRVFQGGTFNYPIRDSGDKIIKRNGISLVNGKDI